MLTRAAGQKGVLTELDVQKIINALPKLTDTKASAQLKMATLRSLYEAIKNGAIEAYTSPISELAGEGTLKEQIIKKGFNYDQMKADNLSDEEIKKAVGL